MGRLDYCRQLFSGILDFFDRMSMSASRLMGFELLLLVALALVPLVIVVELLQGALVVGLITLAVDAPLVSEREWVWCLCL